MLQSHALWEDRVNNELEEIIEAVLFKLPYPLSAPRSLFLSVLTTLALCVAAQLTEGSPMPREGLKVSRGEEECPAPSSLSLSAGRRWCWEAGLGRKTPRSRGSPALEKAQNWGVHLEFIFVLLIPFSAPLIPNLLSNQDPKCTIVSPLLPLVILQPLSKPCLRFIAFIHSKLTGL